MTTPNALAIVGMPLHSLEPLRDAHLHPGAVLDRIAACAADLRAEVSASGTSDLVDTFDLITLPYPTRFGLWRAASSPAPFVAITNRMLVVRWSEHGGRTRTLLLEPSDVDLGTRTPYFADLAQRTPRFMQKLERRPTCRSMRRQHAAEAGAVAEPAASRYRTWPYDRLVEELLDMPTIAEVAGKSGASYQVEVEGFWDSGRPGDLRVMVAMDDGGFSAFRPLTVGFIVRPDGTFVGR